MLRRISTKLVVAVLLTVVLPFVVFAVFINEQMGDRLTRHVVQQALMGLVKDLGGQIDYFIDERHQDLDLWSNAPSINLALDDDLFEQRMLERARVEGGDPESGGPPWSAASVALLARGRMGSGDLDVGSQARALFTSELDRYVARKAVYDVLLLIADDGRLVTCSSRTPEGEPLSFELLECLFLTDFSREEWFQRTLDEERIIGVDHHTSPYRIYEAPPDEDQAWNYHVGFAAPVRESNSGAVRGVLYGLVNWKFIQDIVAAPVVKDAFRGLVKPPEEPSPYSWIWASDGDTILGHPKRSLYYKSVSKDLGLPQMVEAVRENRAGWGLYPEYTFLGEEKNAAFRRCAVQDGFSWVVGVGIDNDDIYATAEELSDLLLGGTAFVLVMATLWTFVIARRTTGPILELQRYTRRVAEGDLDAQVDISSRDELGHLADDFNAMTRELKAQRGRLVKAEKDAAWREMARQIAHDIKNPLTPIKLSLDLLERVRRNGDPNADEILDRTTELMQRQVENLREIAADFYEFTGGRKARPGRVDAGELLDEVLHLHDAWAVEKGVQMQRAGRGGLVNADVGKLRRVLVNLVSNALQAMPNGGELFADVDPEGDEVVIRIRDTGTGISEDVREHLFEPYFTTKGEGTGLGLAISKRVIEELHGSITLEPAPWDEAREGRGTLATVRLERLDETPSAAPGEVPTEPGPTGPEQGSEQVDGEGPGTS